MNVSISVIEAEQLAAISGPENPWSKLRTLFAI
jgi:hypothetical protein